LKNWMHIHNISSYTDYIKIVKDVWWKWFNYAYVGAKAFWKSSFQISQ
jgi:hypothetical protein